MLGFFSSSQSIPRFFVRYAMKEAKKQHNGPRNRYVDILPCESALIPEPGRCCRLREGGRDTAQVALFVTKAKVKTRVDQSAVHHKNGTPYIM